jgi:hypothetical protein
VETRPPTLPIIVTNEIEDARAVSFATLIAAQPLHTE